MFKKQNKNGVHLKVCTKKYLKKEKKKKIQLLSQDPRVTAGHLYPMFSTGALTLTPSGVTYSSNEHM